MIEEQKNSKQYLVRGNFLIGKKYQKFCTEITTNSSPEEKIYSILGSRHNVKRRNIHIENIEELAGEK